MVRRTAAEAAATREALLDAAEQVFRERGVACATLERIAQQAGLTRGAIYWHFRDKNDLFAAMLERVRLPLEEIAESYRQHHPGEDPLGVLQHLCRLALARLADNETYRNVYDILMNRCEFASDINPAFSRQVEIYNENIRTVRAEFERALALGQLRAEVDPRIAALTLGALMHGLYVSWLRQPSRFDIRADGEKALELFFAGLRADQANDRRAV